MGVLETILGGGAYVHGRDREGTTALHKAAEADQAGAIDALMDAGAYCELTDCSLIGPLF